MNTQESAGIPGRANTTNDHKIIDECLVVVHSARDEIEAATIVNALHLVGIDATMQGQHTGSFRAENWTDVRVATGSQVAARDVIAEFHESGIEIDWDQVDVDVPLH